MPVPTPVAARCVIRGLSYTADIIMHEIQDAQPLANILTQRALSKDEWRTIGNVLRRFHRLGYQHVDLNANNILLDHTGDVYLIDFDRCLLRPYKESWAINGLTRLERSLKKLQGTNKNFYFQDTEFQVLFNAYKE